MHFTKPAIYKIVVHGDIDGESAMRLWGLQVSTTKGKNQKIITTLVGMINDQSQLSGILNTLYDRHMTVISVNMLSETEYLESKESEQ
jgi:hypothetical protein